MRCKNLLWNGTFAKTSLDTQFILLTSSRALPLALPEILAGPKSQFLINGRFDVLRLLMPVPIFFARLFATQSGFISYAFT